jgi:L-fuconolactonase
VTPQRGVADGLFLFDSQVHLWLPASSDRPWPPGGGPSHRPPAALADDLLQLMDDGGVAAAVLVPPSFEGYRSDYALDVAAAHPGRFVVQGRFRLDDPAVAEEIRRLKSLHPSLRGVRVTFNRDEARWLVDGSIDWFWPLARELDLAVSLFLWPASATADGGEAAAFDAVAAANPELRLSLDRFGVAAWVDGRTIRSEVQRLKALSRHPNVGVKLSAFANIVGREGFDVDALRAVLVPLVDWFGPSRLFWGTDITGSPVGYAEQIAVFIEALAEYTSDEVALVMGGGLRDWLGTPAI